MTSLLDADHNEDSLLNRLAEIERRLDELETYRLMGLFPEDTTMELPGQLLMEELTTESFKILDAGSSGATEQDWVEVEVEEVTGYLHVFAAK